MSDEFAIKVENVTKVYKLYNAPIDRLKEAFHWSGKRYHTDFYALDNISIEIRKGECIGIIGKNGAGKSTLLKIITGVLTPTSGNVKINGKISALLELGAGFNPEYTGMENIYFQGNLMGYSNEEIGSKVNDILEFAGINEDFIYQPVKTFSSGMFARLAFAIAISIEPDILIVDETLSVGDMFFQSKSLAKMKQLITNDKTTVLFVTHDIASIKAMCSKAIFLERGKVKRFDKVPIVTQEYFNTIFEQEQAANKGSNKIEDRISILPTTNHKHLDYSNHEFLAYANFQRVQNGKAMYTNVVLLDENDNLIKQVHFKQKVKLKCYITVKEYIHSLVFGFHVRTKNGIELLYDDNVLQDKLLFDVKPAECFILEWHFKVYLQQGNYDIATVLSIPINYGIAKVDMCDFIPIACQFEVISPQENIYAYNYAQSKLLVLKQ